MSFIPEAERKMLKVVEELDAANIPMSDWADYTSPAEYVLLEPLLKEEFSRKTMKVFKRRNRRANKPTSRDLAEEASNRESYSVV
jgi:hypothetical protein